MKNLATLIILTTGLWASAQTTFQEQAARLQNINAFLLDFRPAGAPILFDEAQLELSFDLNPQPSLNTRVGNKNEPIDTPNVVPKLRGRYQFGGGLFVGAAYAPGIEFQDYEADYISLELGYRKRLLGFDLSLRASYSDGDVLGPITDAQIDDLFTFTNRGLDLSVGKTFGDWHFYVFGGGIDVETELDITSDGVHLVNDESTYYGGAGVTYDWRRFGLTLEQNFTDDYLANLILGISYRF